MGLAQAALPFRPDSRKQDLSRITFVYVVSGLHAYATMVQVRASVLALLIIAMRGGPLPAQITVPPAATPAPYEGLPIESIVFDPVRQPLDPGQIGRILPLKVRQPYHNADASEAIRRLYATGRYEDIVVEANRHGAGIEVRITTRNSWFIGRVEIQGDIPEPPNAGQLATAAGLELGQPFDPAQLKTAIGNMSRLLTADGIYRSQIDSDLEHDDITQQVNIVFSVSTSKRARFAPPVIKSDTQVLTDQQIIKASRWRWILLKKWHQVTQQRVNNGVEKIRLKFQDTHHLLATVLLESMDYDPESNRASPHLAITAGPSIVVKAEGAKVKEKRLKTEVPIYEEHSVDQDLLQEGSRNLRDYFQSQGYFDVKVSFQEGRIINDKEEIDYRIELGERHRLVAIEIAGNHYFNQKVIRERLLVLQKSFEQRRGRYSEAYLKRDQQSIAELYKMNGFRDVSVAARAVDDYKGRIGDIAVFFTIDEGKQWRIANLTVTGARALDLSSVLHTLSSEKGQPFSEFNVAADRDSILAHYFRNGFASATFEWNSTPGEEPQTVNLEFRIAEGRQQFVRNVLVDGLQTTKWSLVENQIRISPGDPLSPIAVAETQRRLYDLGVFARVDAAVQNPDGDEDQKYVLYQLEEARRYSITGGFGAEIARIGGSTSQADLTNPEGAPGFSPRVSLDASRINAFGIGDTVTFHGRLSTLQKRAAVDYLRPRLFDNRNFDIDFSALYDDSRDVRTFGAKREEAAVQLTERKTKATTFFYRYAFRNVTVNNLKIDPLLVPALSQAVHTGIISANVVQDRRDDPADAHTGIYNAVDVGLAARILGSRNEFARVVARNSTYNRIHSKFVFARQTVFGVMPAYHIPPDADPSDPIPLAERFYSGGVYSHRGFPENQAGPRDTATGFPLGGSAEFFNNTEFRFPLIGGNINGVLFHDMGNVYSSIGKMSFRVNQTSVEDFNYMVHAVGFGVRYRTPIGPIRVDLAYSINPPHFNGFSGTYTDLVNCTATNTCTSALQQINHFQFFFSIGQAF